MQCQNKIAVSKVFVLLYPATNLRVVLKMFENLLVLSALFHFLSNFVPVHFLYFPIQSNLIALFAIAIKTLIVSDASSDKTANISLTAGFENVHPC